MMKAFKEWLENYSHGEIISQRYELNDAWKAALAWALYNANCAGESDRRPCELKILIREELEDGF